MLRIISGEFKGKILRIPKVNGVRPTRELVRKAIFDILKEVIAGTEVLDLFSGSGALGFEALSRGAKTATFIEKHRQCAKILKENAALLKIAHRYEILTGDVFFYLNKLQDKGLCFKLIFADPPYYQELAKKCLLSISKCDILIPFGILVLEHYKKDELPQRQGKLVLWQRRNYGDTMVSFYISEGNK